MNKHLKRALKLVLFLAILLGINFLLSKVYESIIMSSHRLALSTRRMLPQAKKGGIDVLVLGDSHPGATINPNFFDGKVVKWTSGGERYHQNFYKLKYFLSSFEKPRVLVLPIDPHSFKAYRKGKGIGQGGNDVFWVKYMDYMEFGSTMDSTSKYLAKYIKGRFLPYAGESAGIYQWILRNYINRSKAGFALDFIPKNKKKPKKPSKKKPGPVKKTRKKNPGPKATKAGEKKKRQLAAKKRAVMQFYGKRPFGPVKIEYFKKIIAICKDNNIKIVLVKFPVTYEYYRYVSEHIMDVEKYYKKITGEILENDRTIHILDYQTIFFNRPHLMKDPDHVNFIGGKIISKKMNKVINRLLLDNAVKNEIKK